MILYLSVTALVLIIIHISFNYNERARLLNKIPGPKGSFIIGNGSDVMASSVELMKLGKKWSLKWKDIFKLWIFPIGCVIVYNPEDIEIAISSVRFNDKSYMYHLLTPWLRDGLLLSKGEKWHQRRKLLTPAFHFNILRQFYVVIRENSERLVKRLEEPAAAGQAVDVAPLLSEYTLHTICETSMGTKLNDETAGAGKTYKSAIYGIGQIFLYRFIRIHLLVDFLFSFTSAFKTMQKYLKTVHDFTGRVIRDRREYVNKYGVQLPDDKDDDDFNIYKNRKKTAMLDLLLLAEKDGYIDTAGIQEEVDTFMFEGHDTTASGLTFCLLSLANNKPIQVIIIEWTMARRDQRPVVDKIYSELQEIFGDSTRPATMDDLSKMKYLDMCIKESLRLYPPVHFISRNLQEPVVLSGYQVPANTFCHINILCLHQNPHLYKDPLVFDPDRFLPENIATRHPYAYIPFSAGPRNCIGQKFAMMEMKSAVSEILRKFELQPVTRHEDIEFMADLVLRNSGPVYVTFVKR